MESRSQSETPTDNIAKVTDTSQSPMPVMPLMIDAVDVMIMPDGECVLELSSRFLPFTNRNLAMDAVPVAVVRLKPQTAAQLAQGVNNGLAALADANRKAAQKKAAEVANR